MVRGLGREEREPRPVEADAIEVLEVRIASRLSEAYGFRFFLPVAPTEQTSFSRAGDRLRGAGAGTVRLRTPGGKRLKARLSFEVKLP